MEDRLDGFAERNRYLERCSDYFESIDKMENADSRSDDIGGFDYEDSSYYFELLKRAAPLFANQDDEEGFDEILREVGIVPSPRESADGPETGFGRLKEGVDFDSLIDSLPVEGMENITSSFNAANLFCAIVQERPFVSHNAQIAGIFALDALERASREKGGKAWGRSCVSGSDLAFAYRLVAENAGKSRAEVAKLIEPLFRPGSSKFEEAEMKERLAAVKKEPSPKNVCRYIVAFIEHYRGHQGFYEYYASVSGGIYKLHYSAEFSDFRLDYAKTAAKKGALVFECDALARIEAPLDLKNREEVLASLEKETKERGYERIIGECLATLKGDLKPHWIDGIEIEFNPNWECEVETLYDF